VAASAPGPEGLSELAELALVSAFEATLASAFEVEFFALSFEEQLAMSTASERTAIRFFIFIFSYYKNELQSAHFKNYFRQTLLIVPQASSEVEGRRRKVEGLRRKVKRHSMI
jgi:hypothetical protein